ncbi:hypothetical protein BDR22DRAFT_890328 [Usnea florida]
MTAPNSGFSQGFNAGLQRLFDANEGDVVFVCGPLNKNVHGLLLGARSKVFATMLNGSFQEGLSKRIELKDQDPYLAMRMLFHLYGFDYSGHKISIGDEEEPSHISELYTHASMYALGDEYGISDLKEEALWKFKRTMEAKEGDEDELESVMEVVPVVYTTTLSSDRGLRDAVVAFGAKNLNRMKDLSVFESAVTQVPAYIIEVLPGILQHSGVCQCCNTVRTYCLKCQRVTLEKGKD